ncbi:MAG TPA: PA14 domain-containing protein [Longimicrobium sp.]|uniref:PA14 domain-containing protein n=1 Tax=Longimicrobium sp. TaxID=2029185 RepID=UPI002EDB0F09
MTRPTVSIDPAQGSYANSTVGVTIYWSDNVGLDAGAHSIYLNGEDVRAQFTYSGTATSAQSVGTVTLNPGQNTLEAEVWDQAGNDWSASASYAYTQPPPLSCPVGQYLATYYAGVNLSGSPIQTACAAKIDHDWGAGTLNGTVGGDHFSARWVGRHSFGEATYRFTVTADDGVRLWVDGVLLIDRWVDQGPTTYTADRVMTAGEHEVKVEYYERGGGALVRSGWSVPTVPMTSGATPSLREVVQGIYRLVKEREGEPAGVDYWVAKLESGWTVKQAIRSFGTSPEQYERFVAGRPARAVAATLYRHIYAREGRPDELDYWEPIVARGGWVEMVDGLLAYWTYGEWFGDHAVPGYPVALWDARRAHLVLDPQTGFADKERDLCLTVAVPGGASECGELRLAHALPAIRTLNTVRAPILVYNSQHARPMPVVAGRVMLPADRGTPTRVEAVLSAGPNYQLVKRANRAWAGSEWPLGQARRIALAYDAANDPEGVYRYLLEVTATYSDGSTLRWAMRGSLAVVNRRQSPFGAGWWLAGLEQLRCIECGPTTSYLLIGGDGSTRVYEPLAENPANLWIARTPDRGTDTLRVVADYPNARFVRYLPGKVRVYYDAAGRHVATVNRLEHHTHFGYDASGRLATVRVPAGAGYSAYKPEYRFTYGAGGSNGRLYSVTAPDLNGGAGRQVVIGPQNGDHRVGTIQDPDGTYVEYAYFDAGRPEAVSRRTDRRRVTGGAHYFYDAGGKLAKVSLDMGEMVDGVYGEGDDLITWFTNAETRGLAEAPVAPHDAYSIVDGPRRDVVDRTYFWPDRFGGPWRIVNALGQETVLTRSDLRFPGLVTRMDGPVGADGRRHTTGATYDARGNLSTSTSYDPLGDGRSASTSYNYDPAWPDFVAKVTLPEGEVTRIGYHPSGNRAWQQPGDNTTHAVRFDYNAAGLLEWIRLPATAAQPEALQRFEYDTRGNLEYSTTPLGLQSGLKTRSFNDNLGRTWKTESPIDGVSVAITVTTFDGADRPKIVTTSAPMLHGPNPGQLQTVAVENHYDNEGNVLRVDRWSTPDPTNIRVITTRWDYDAAGRAIREWAPDATPTNSTDNPRDSTVYDPAGNPTVVITRRGDTIRTRFDVLRRPFWRSTSAFRYAAVADSGIPTRTGVQEGCDNSNDNIYLSYPYYPSNTADCSLTIPGDTTHFGYDEMGNLRRAENRFARVRRGYYPNGQLRADTLKIQTLALNDTTKHVYALGYTYDLNGRRTVLHHPAGLAPAAGAVTRYTYDPLTGELESVTDPLNHGFTFQYDQRGQLSSRTLPANARRGYGYDQDGRLTRDTLWVPTVLSGGPLDNMVAEYDQRGKLLFSNNLTRSEEWMRNRYSGLGHLVEYEQRSRALNHANDIIKHRAYGTYQYDALGNTHVTTSSHARRMADSNDSTTTGGTSTYQPYTGRQTRVSPGSGTSTSYAYDRSGNQNFQVTGSGTTANDRVSYYAADGTLRFAETRSLTNLTEHRLTWEEYRYDPLGRRILVRERNWCDYVTNRQECSFNTIRRTVWDGDQVLYEIQMEDSDLSRENDTERRPADHMPPSIFDPNVLVGRVLLTHGPGMDQPLSVIRMHYVADEVLDWPNFAVIPIWNTQGRAPYVMFSDGQRTLAHPAHPNIKLGTWWLLAKEAYGPANNAEVTSPSGYDQVWLGSVMEDQQDASGLLYRRNRYYDPATGRFTQEDPIGLAGGLNLYGFAAGDPVSYSDPYGLKVCYKGSARQVEALRSATSEAVGAKVTLDRTNCISEVGATSNRRLAGLRNRLALLAGIDDIYNVSFSARSSETDSEIIAGAGRVGQSWSGAHPNCPGTVCPRRVEIGSGWAQDYRSTEVLGFCMPWGSTRPTLANVVAHELIGHGFEFYAYGNGAAGLSEMHTIRSVDNIYQAAMGMPRRCGH